jgi:hypothetical protein
MRPEEDPDAQWVERLVGCAPELAGERLAEASRDRALFRHLAREHAREGRRSYIEIDAPLELYALVRLLRPFHVVEVGVSSGVSSAYLLRALHKNRRGILHSIDLPKPPPKKRSSPPRDSWSLPEGRESGWAIPAALKDRWDLRLGDKRELLPQLARELPEVSLFVYDVPHDDDDATREFRTIDPLFPPGAVAIADHGPGGGLCVGLRRWATRRGGTPIRRSGLGLYGFRCGHPSATSRATERSRGPPAR